MLQKYAFIANCTEQVVFDLPKLLHFEGFERIKRVLFCNFV